jgi:(p)ppGpp synthase/HD superfamily hydrolase
MNRTLIENLVSDTVRTNDYKIENDQSDHEDYIDPKIEKINQRLGQSSFQQLNNKINPKIIYSNYRKLFNKTLEKYYKEQVCFIFLFLY